MNDLLRMATAEIARFLAAGLPSLGPDWWTKHVLNRLSFQQQRTARDRGFKTLQQLDFAALLRVLDQNWHELKDNIPSAYEARTWAKELQTVRNKWAHLSAEAMPASEVYRDADNHSWTLKFRGKKPVVVTYGGRGKTGATVENPP